MWEFELWNEKTQEQDFIFGYSLEDAWARNPSKNREDWVVVYEEYID